MLRVPVLYGDVIPAGNNSESAVNVLLDTVYKASETGTTANISMDDWALRYPTNTLDVGRVCKDIAEKYLSNRDSATHKTQSLPQILHFSSEDRYTKYEICQLIAEVLGVSIEDGMKPNKQGNEPGKAVRPYDAHLDTKELKDLGIDVSTMDFAAWWYVTILSTYDNIDPYLGTILHFLPIAFPLPSYFHTDGLPTRRRRWHLRAFRK